MKTISRILMKDVKRTITYKFEKIWSIIEKLIRKRYFLESKTAVISFTFDDAPVSSFKEGGRILEKNGLKGTYYISGGLINKNTSVGRIIDYRTLTEFHKKGHEIANHTFSHIDCSKKSPISMIHNILKNRQKLKNMVSKNFAYPYGSINIGARIVANLFSTSARGTLSGINEGEISLVNLKAEKIYNRLGINNCLDFISQCSKNGGWLIFYTHDIDEKPSNFGCTPDQFSKIVEAVKNKKIDVLTVQQAVEMFKN